MFQLKVLVVGLLTITIAKALNDDGSASANFANDKEFAEYLGIEARIQEKEFQKLARCISNRTTNGIPSLGIPPLDPIKFPILPLYLNNNFVQAKMLLTKIRFEGLGQFVLEIGSINTLRSTIHLKIVFKKIELSAKYNGSIKLFNMLKIYGKGHLSIALKDFVVDATVKYKLKLISQTMKLTGLTLDIKLPYTDAKITGLLHDEYMSRLISEQLSDAMTTLAAEQSQPISDLGAEIGWKILDAKVNPTFEGKKLSEIMGEMDKNTELICGPYFEEFVQHYKTVIEDNLNLKLDEDYLNEIAKNYEDLL